MVKSHRRFRKVSYAKMAPIVERVTDIPVIELGEGPHWDIQTESLYFVDLFGKAIHRYVPRTGQCTKAEVGKHVSVIIPIKGNCQQFVIGLERELSLVTWDGISEKPSKIEKIADVDKGTQNRMNDGKCDANGRLWVGTMGPEPINGHVEPDLGSLYSWNKGKLQQHLTNLGVSNGLAWSSDSKKFYFTDTFTYKVDEFDYDIENGTISNRKTIFTPNKHGIKGSPDGMTIDVDGNLWMALFNGYKIVKFDPRKPETLLKTIDIPAKQVTSLAWGGPQLDILYVTTAGFTVDGEVLPPPDHGATYQITGLGTKGLPAASCVLIMAPKILRVAEIPNLVLGEGPHWDIETQNLYIVDIFGKSIHKFNASTGQHSKAIFDKPVSFIVPVKGQRNKFVISLEREICVITWDGISERPSKIEKLAEVDQDTQNRINDGKCDPRGRLWAGTMGPEPEPGHFQPEAGSLFSLDGGEVTTFATKVGISNGLAWNTKLGKFYYNDSLVKRVDEFDYDINSGVISNRKTIFTFSKHDIDGLPDGMTIDADGNLWVAVFNGSSVIKIDPRKPETLLETIKVPAKQTTSVAWGGIDLNILYVTSASMTVDGVELLPPNHGATFQITGLGTKGLPADNFVSE
ncbi:hypothetical protein HUJ05_007872 [Dendroctonus ponderosae]|nr:hypothetical protein HUJ05_007872 [Dendroctonus ponderosae]KAH1017173.1 hypothetical protein HUJ05_007872 [Dendroctonus ponderosae]